MVIFQCFCIINLPDVPFNFYLCQVYTFCTSAWENSTRWESTHISKSVVRPTLPGLDGCTKESVSHSDVTFEDAITAVAESNLLITWRVQRWAVCEINLMLSVTRQDRKPVFLEHSRIGCSFKVRLETETSDLNEIFSMLKQADGIYYTSFQLEIHKRLHLLCLHFRKKLFGVKTI